MPITMTDIKKILADLKTRKPPTKMDSDKPLSHKEAIRHLAARLSKMKTRGFTTADLVEILKEHHIDVKGRDLNRYLNEYRSDTNTVRVSRGQTAAEAPPMSKPSREALEPITGP